MEGKTFLQLRKSSRGDARDFPSYRLAVLGDCATQHLCTALKGYAFDESLHLEIFEADYNQIDAQLLDRESELYTFAPQGVLFCLCAEKLHEKFSDTPWGERETFAERTMEKIRSYWDTLNREIRTHILQFNFVEIDDRIFGNFANKTPFSFLYQLRKLNYLLMNAAGETKNVFLLDLASLQNHYGRNCIYDSKFYYMAKMPLSTEILPAVAGETLKVLNALRGKFKKAIILDLDNTLWGGVIGDDGLNGIEIGELGRGRAFSDFQRWLKDLQSRGIILAVCSKNEDSIAREPFLHHPEMILRLEDISLFVANWEDKASNIRHIQQTLNLGMDSFVFLDDNPFERNLVSGMIPEITVPDLPEDPALYVDFLADLNLFETVSFSEEDQSRTQQYRQEVKRKEQETQYSSFSDYLKNLDMVAEFGTFSAFYCPRIAQLTQRSNQFNLRTVRYTEGQIAELIADDRHLTLYFSLADKFGEYGLISVVILEKHPRATLFIENWVMSCRVLKRGMEEFIMNTVIETATANGFQTVAGEYLPTPKNKMVKSIYREMGFEDCGNGYFQIAVSQFSPRETYISTKGKNDGTSPDFISGQ